MKFKLTAQKDARKGLETVVSQLNKVSYLGPDDIVDDRDVPNVLATTGAATFNTTNYVGTISFGPLCFCNIAVSGNVTVNVLTFTVDLPIKPKLRSGSTNKQPLAIDCPIVILGGVLTTADAHVFLSVPAGKEIGRLEVSAPNWGFWTPGAFAFAGSFIYPIESSV